jgi:endonuclease III
VAAGRRSGTGARQPLARRRPGRAKTLGKARVPAPPPGRGAAAPRRPRSAASAVPRKHPGTRAISRERLPAHAAAIFDLLHRAYPDAHCELDFRNAFQLLIATILSAQCTDKRVNMVTPQLFTAFPTPAALATADPARIEDLIRSTGFFRNKTKSLLGMARALEERFDGRVPETLAELVTLPGVGRKTANVILGNAFERNEGIVVDTHVERLANRLGLTKRHDAVKIEQDLMPLFPRERWALLSHLLIWHGRRVCDAKKPRCGECVLRDLCPSALV